VRTAGVSRTSRIDGLFAAVSGLLVPLALQTVYPSDTILKGRALHGTKQPLRVSLSGPLLSQGVLMTRSVAIRWIGCVLVVVILVLASTAGQVLMPDAHGFITAQPEDLLPPPGSRSVRILGDPSQSGNYVMRITFAPGTGTSPHFHNQARYITVLEGTWWVARGPDAETYDVNKMVPVKAGSFLYQPANGIHYDQARNEAVTVQISGMGPLQTTRLESGR